VTTVEERPSVAATAQEIFRPVKLPTDSVLDVQLSIPALVWFVATHAIALTLAVPFVSLPAFLVFVFLHTVFGVSITLGAHRYFSHLTFKAPRWLEVTLGVLFTMSFDRCGEGIISWVVGHKYHHAHSDRELDPHSPEHGYWHAYCGHYIYRRRDLYEFTRYKDLCPELSSDPLLVWLDRPRNIWLIQAVTIIVLVAIGGLVGPRDPFDPWMAMSFFVWCVCVRYCYTQFIHSLVDTANHGVWPFHLLRDTYATNTRSKNCLVLWLVRMGNETWHNVHHAFPRAANNGGSWYRWDLDSLIMKGLERLGVISNLTWITEEQLERRRQRGREKSAQ
jgi:stearoyl-CoA desaturase (delta-9 desaturase)